MKWIGVALLIFGQAFCIGQETPARRFALTQLQVERALAANSVTVADDQVSLPANLVSATQEPRLDVESIERPRVGPKDSRVRFSVKLVCHSPELCLPFYVVVSRRSDLGLPAVAVRQVSGKAVSHPVPLPISMHAGVSATLVLDTAHMHVQLPVICLQSGAVGARVHVSSPDHKQNYTATIVSPTLLTGAL